jgi:predicted dehydrogenase
MNSRRSFVKKIGASAALSSFALSSVTTFASQSDSRPDPKEKKIRIGIIGAENTHTIIYGKMFNTDKKFPGVEVLYGWGETEELAKNAMLKGNIPNMVKDPKEMLGKIDALIVDHRHAMYHLEVAVPFIKAGIPTFIDKPFCYRISEGKEFLALAKKLRTPVTSYSTTAYSNAAIDLKNQTASLGKISQVVRCGPVDIDSEYGGIFFYGVHLLQPLMNIFGEDVERVKVTRNGKNGSAGLVFKSGLYATLVFKNNSSGWETFVETKDGLVELKSRTTESDPAICYVDMVEMFKTGKEPRTHQSILSDVAVLEALEKSTSSQEWENVIY